jgi:nicotinamide riboside transporter PnuC
MTETVSAIAGILAITGVVLNNRRLRACFVIWILSNLMSAEIHLAAGLWSLAARDLVFLCLAVEGWVKWGKR